MIMNGVIGESLAVGTCSGRQRVVHWGDGRKCSECKVYAYGQTQH